MVLLRRLASSFTTRSHRPRFIRHDSSLLPTQLTAPLEVIDPEIAHIIELEKARQWKGLTLIPSENFAPVSVMQAVGSVMANKNSEGHPGARYYGGNQYIDMAECLCKKRTLQAFRLDPAKWGVNVQSLSRAPANFQVYTALLKPHERIMALDLPHGGHISHGYQAKDITDLGTLKTAAKFFVPGCRKARTGDLCGETGVLCYRPQLFTVSTKYLETEDMLAHRRTDLPLSLRFAAIKRDDLLLHQLLRRGLDPYEADNNKWTHLHITASKGSENCVLLLLDYGADPNSRVEAETDLRSSIWVEEMCMHVRF